MCSKNLLRQISHGLSVRHIHHKLTHAHTRCLNNLGSFCQPWLLNINQSELAAALSQTLSQASPNPAARSSDHSDTILKFHVDSHFSK
jgi:hypothetical protein